MSEPNSDNVKSVRTTVTVPVTDYQEIEQLSKDKKVSVAWIIRDAIEQYLTTHPPQDHQVQDRPARKRR